MAVRGVFAQAYIGDDAKARHFLFYGEDRFLDNPLSGISG